MLYKGYRFSPEISRRRHRVHTQLLVFHRDGIPVRTWKTCSKQACTAVNLPGRDLH
jgi:hypothetical protein